MLGGLAALLLSTTAGSAVTQISLNGCCNTYAVRHYNFGHFAAKEIGCGTGFGGGLLASIKGVGKTAVIALQDSNTPGSQLEIVFSYPFTNGGSWELYGTSDGVHFNTLAGGSYAIGAPAERGTKSVTARR